MAGYCEIEDVKVYIGTKVSDADLAAILKDADAQIDAYFSTRGVSLSDRTVARQASIMLTRALVAERFAMTGENPTSYSTGDYSQSGSADFFSLSKGFRAQAFEILHGYLMTATTATTNESTFDVTRSDAVLPDFHLDQTDDPTFYKESVTIDNTES